MVYRYCRSIALIGIIAVACAGQSPLPVSMSLNGQNPEKLTEEQMRDFLLTAKVVKGKELSKGVTRPYQLTLSDGTLVHNAGFSWIDETKAFMEFGNGRKEMNFRDSYKYNIAAFELAKLVGLGEMMPVTVERKWEGKLGSLSWWLTVKMDEGARRKKKIRPPDPEAWNRQMHKMWVFSQLVYDTDRNMGNVLISEDWHLWMIDFTRAFRLYTTLENPNNLVRCDRQLLQKMRQLDAEELALRTKGFLNSAEIKGVMARRDRILAHFEALVAKKGEAVVLYD